MAYSIIIIIIIINDNDSIMRKTPRASMCYDA